MMLDFSNTSNPFSRRISLALADNAFNLTILPVNYSSQ
jgi:hypothetical protein